jgi:D-glycero-alpha-D-manno-heptose-7-phosphate kinase
MSVLLQMREQAYQLQKLLGNGRSDLQAFGELLDEGWHLKQQLASKITTTQIDTWYDQAKHAGALGGKLCGAGGGGFLLFVVRPTHQGAVRKALPELTEVPIGPEVHGSQILLLE